MKRIEAKTLEELYSVLRQLKDEQADIISVKKFSCGYTIQSQTREEAVMGDMQADYNRLRRMERRINSYPDLRKAVRAAMEHEDNKIDLYLNQYEKSSLESAQPSRSTSEPHPSQP